MRPFVLLCLLVIAAMTSFVDAFPGLQTQSRYRKSQPQDANIQPFIRFRKSLRPVSWNNDEILYEASQF
ncbi:unnamed protein product [Caenorhabditis auriculariae]|uniref:Uncharacterized protein n=1 Tax=Caenorhabditis auriculariae TaxID=2777116 RepID=A0A8S1HHL6_9PELO|nr:unnamed protein product [Caenorhabditis auriculariae]